MRPEEHSWKVDGNSLWCEKCGTKIKDSMDIGAYREKCRGRKNEA